MLRPELCIPYIKELNTYCPQLNLFELSLFSLSPVLKRITWPVVVQVAIFKSGRKHFSRAEKGKLKIDLIACFLRLQTLVFAARPTFQPLDTPVTIPS
jgi:hypothetical protein